jgi:hypothetical protein
MNTSGLKGLSLNTNTTINNNLTVAISNPTMIIRGNYENETAKLFFGIPFTSTSALKCASIAQGISGWLR